MSYRSRSLAEFVYYVSHQAKLLPALVQCMSFSKCAYRSQLPHINSCVAEFLRQVEQLAARW
jgi:hypothetical protein